jgi:hypothetical protein
MIELLSMLFGGVFRLLPEVLGFFKKRTNNDHEYRMTQLQLDIDKNRASQQLDLVHANAEMQDNAMDFQALMDAIKGQSVVTGIKWIDGLSSSVRPILTYWWCMVLYTSYKLVLLYSLLNSHADLVTIAAQLITEFDRSIVGSIFAFWFVDRALRKSK